MKNKMRTKTMINNNWHWLKVENEPQVPKHCVAGMYFSAKTERLKWGPGSRTHEDLPNPWNDDSEISAEQWKIVDLPHDYIVDQTPVEEEGGPRGFFHYYKAWYRKHLTIPSTDKDKRICIYFEGITGICDVYFNGCFMKHNDGGYTPFEIDVTDYIYYDDDNVISILVNPDSYETWWYAGGGIYRNVWLIKTDRIAVDLWGVFAPATKISDTEWNLDIETTIHSSEYEEYEVKVLNELIDSDGNLVESIILDATAIPRSKTMVRGKMKIISPALWDIYSPNLYTVKTTIYRNNLPCDIYKTEIGFRTIELSATDGLFLNGRNIKLKGVCAHMDFGLTGKAVPDNICRYRIDLLKSMHVNAYRTSHYPHNEATMDALDKAGILVMDEVRRFESNEDNLKAVETLIKRDRNHPSVFIWSTGNEELVYHTLPQGANIHRAMSHTIKQLDPTRPTTSALGYPIKCTIFKEFDVISANYSLKDLETIHNRYPDKPFISSENCAVGSTRGWYLGDEPAYGYLDARDRDRDPETWYWGREGTWKYIMRHKWNCGCFQWIAFDHRGEAIWPRLSSASGAFDMFLQKKDAFYQNLSHWSDEPMIHILPHWNHKGMEGVPVNVWVYTNCEECELFLNGKSLGRRKTEKYTHLEWDIPFEAGKLEAIGYNDNKVAVQDIQETTGKATALKLKLENAPLYANGHDVALFTCYAVDENGLEVPDASGLVRFHSTGGKIIGTGSSNSDHTPVSSPVRQMYAGRIAVAVRVTNNPGKLTLYSECENLYKACCSTEVLPSNNALQSESEPSKKIDVVIATQ